MPPIVLHINKKTFGIVGICSGSDGHCTDAVVVKQRVGIFESVDMDEERRQIVRCRNPTAVRIHPSDVHFIRIAWGLIIVFDPLAARSSNVFPAICMSIMPQRFRRLSLMYRSYV